MNMKWNELAKIRMRDMGIGQEKLSEHLGITKGAVSHWLNARREPSLEDIAKIMRYLGLKAFVVNHDGTIAPAGSISNVGGYKPYTPGKRYPVLSKVRPRHGLKLVSPTISRILTCGLSQTPAPREKGFGSRWTAIP